MGTTERTCNTTSARLIVCV